VVVSFGLVGVPSRTDRFRLPALGESAATAHGLRHGASARPISQSNSPGEFFIKCSIQEENPAALRVAITGFPIRYPPFDIFHSSATTLFFQHMTHGSIDDVATACVVPDAGVNQVAG
jgi:hypothetical protein